MSFSFDPKKGLIVLPARMTGPNGDVIVHLALDTGATGSMINWDVAVLLGYDPAAVEERVQVTTGSSVEFVPLISMQTVEAVGRLCHNIPILCHTLPPSATVDGLLGLDFFRGTSLTIDLRSGVIRIE